MKPVNLLPKGSAAVATASGPAKLNVGLIGGIVGGSLLVLMLAGYFAFARVDSIKSETTQAQAAKTQAEQETSSVRSTIASVGKPVNDSDKQLADGEEAVLVSAFSERYNYVELARELQGIMVGTGGFYANVKVTTGGGTDAESAAPIVTIEGYMPTIELAAGFYKRVDGTHSFSDAEGTQYNSKKLLSIYTKKPETYYHFIVTATFEDNIAPTSPTASAGADGSSTGTPVAESDGNLTLSLDAQPAVTKTPAQTKATKAAKAAAAATAAAAAKPKNPFDVAASAVAGGAK